MPADRVAYLETFDDGPGGWIADCGVPLPVWDGVAYCYGPWTVDANHAPPGAGYLHLLMYLPTTARMLGGDLATLGGNNRFVGGGYSRDLRNARLSVRLRGQLEPTGPLRNYAGFRPRWEPGEAPQLLLLAQARCAGTGPNLVLSGAPLELTSDWSEQTVVLADDESQWTCLGSRKDLLDTYGCAPVSQVLQDVNVDLIFVLFPLQVRPAWPVDDMHRAWAARDYPVDPQRLPKGVVMFDAVRIDYA